jgi:hypothetical protein
VAQGEVGHFTDSDSEKLAAGSAVPIGATIEFSAVEDGLPLEAICWEVVGYTAGRNNGESIAPKAGIEPPMGVFPHSVVGSAGSSAVKAVAGFAEGVDQGSLAANGKVAG